MLSGRYFQKNICKLLYWKSLTYLPSYCLFQQERHSLDSFTVFPWVKRFPSTQWRTRSQPELCLLASRHFVFLAGKQRKAELLKICFPSTSVQILRCIYQVNSKRIRLSESSIRFNIVWRGDTVSSLIERNRQESLGLALCDVIPSGITGIWLVKQVTNFMILRTIMWHV